MAYNTSKQTSATCSKSCCIIHLRQRLLASENRSIFSDMLFTLSAKSNGFYLHYVKIAAFPSIYATCCK